jgi:septum formation protein
MAETGNEHSPLLVLASASPARLRMLRQSGIDAEVVVSGVDESTVDSDDPVVLSGTLARLKAETVAGRLRDSGSGPGRLVLGCDSVLEYDGEVLGKPGSAEAAAMRWREIRGRSGVLHTGHCLVDVYGRSAERGASAIVHFADVTDAEISAYVSTGEPLDVAGGFTIDGFGAAFVERVDGDPGTVIGVSVPLLRRLLRELGVEITDLWRQLCA